MCMVRTMNLYMTSPPKYVRSNKALDIYDQCAKWQKMCFNAQVSVLKPQLAGKFFDAVTSRLRCQLTNRSMDQVGSEGREQEHSSGPSRSSLDRLVENIVSHPSFRATISQALLNNSPSASSSLGLESRRNAIRNGTTTLSPHANADETRRFTSPAEEFSAIYRRGSSAIPGQSPQYHRGNNFQRPAPTA